ncbi:MAG: hypothetical protein U0573_08940 [Phycisphaerales bacterium]|nr:hypothetical protein [Planctomycetota bacterium]
MTPDQLRQVLKELDGHREALIAYHNVPEHSATLVIKNAILIPDEPDHTIKVTDGTHIFILNPSQIAYIRITLKQPINPFASKL